MAIPFIYDRVWETTTTTGTGTLTLAGAKTGYRSFAVVGDGNAVPYCITDGTDYEVGVGTYGASGTTLTRASTPLASSNSGAAVSWGAGTKDVFCVAPASLLSVADPSLCAGRLTLTSGTPVTTSDVTAATTIYFTPFKGARIALYDGAAWESVQFSETSLAVGTKTSGANYDVFGYLSSGALALEFSSAWTDAVTRADALALQDGVYVKSSDHTRRYLGTVRTTATTTVEDSARRRFVWNYYNRVRRMLRRAESSFSWSYNSTAIRQANGSSSNQVEVVVGMAEEPVDVEVLVGTRNTLSANASVSVMIGLDATNLDSSLCSIASVGPSTSGPFNAGRTAYWGYLFGYHYLTWLERSDTTGTTYFGAPFQNQNVPGMLGSVYG